MSFVSVLIYTFSYSLFYSKKEKVSLALGATINKEVHLSGANKVGKFTSLRNIKMGYASYVGERSFLCDAKVGKYCSIGDRVSFIVGNHPTTEAISTHPAFYSTIGQAGIVYAEKNCFKEYKHVEDNYSFIIGNDVWIGSDSKLVQGIKIGNGAVIAGGSVVTKDVESYEIVGGVPAKRIKYRFSENERLILENLAWWDFPNERLKELTKIMNNPKEFFEQINN
ncbi:CatB-related O-acetyltransferase [Bacillus sp. AFS015802]|uniref:CatB-related O-acetyltransferase n=1 Tax=Bacillus sp. AFS015802 TaxID=2033486 RepID=UPI00211D82B0|nr:CatB-related O-acetyltransferase [Bacillus sp. AFS015802]